MNESGEEDIMRAFFRTQVGNIGEILPPVLAIAERHSRGLGRDTSTAILEANRIILVCPFCVPYKGTVHNFWQTVLRSALEFREVHMRIYGVELPMIKPWTSQSTIIDALLGLFEGTRRYIENPATGFERNQNTSEPISQLPDLASVVLACAQEKLDWLGRSVPRCIFLLWLTPLL
jgi:nuclear pore complex protein Nup133